MKLVIIKKFVELTGYSRKAIQIKKERGAWKEGALWIKVPDGRILINIHTVQSWMLGAA